MSELRTSFRHVLHAHPELAHAEYATADQVVAFMQQFNSTEIVTAMPGPELSSHWIAVWKALVRSRCELNALPIVETGVNYT